MIKKYYFNGINILLFTIVVLISGSSLNSCTPGNSNSGEENKNFTYNSTETMQLPDPITDGEMSLEEALTLRRSIRSYSNEPLTIEDISQLLWSAQGVTNERGFRTAPSAGATFPLEMYVVVNNSDVLEQGIYHYNPDKHAIKLVRTGDFADDLRSACMGQSMLSDGSVVLVFGAVFARTMDQYGQRGERYVYNEIGHASQNVHLQAAALGLGTVVIGAYSDDDVEEILDLDSEVRVLYLMPAGKER